MNNVMSRSRIQEGYGLVAELYGSFGAEVSAAGLLAKASPEYVETPCSLGDCPKLARHNQTIIFGDTIDPKVESVMPRSQFREHLVGVLMVAGSVGCYESESIESHNVVLERVQDMLDQAQPPVRYSPEDTLKLARWMLEGEFDDHAGLEEVELQSVV